MTLAVGCDVVDVGRMGARLRRRPGLAARLFTEGERDDARRSGVPAGSPRETERLAARFAAKEATRKALGELRLGFHDTEVVTATDGAPRLRVRGRDLAASVSLSHDGGVAMAVVLVDLDLPAPASSTTPDGTDRP